MMPKTEEDTRGREEDQTAANASLPPRRRGARDDDDASRFVSPLVTRPALLLVHGCHAGLVLRAELSIAITTLT